MISTCSRSVSALQLLRETHDDRIAFDRVDAARDNGARKDCCSLSILLRMLCHAARTF